MSTEIRVSGRTLAFPSIPYDRNGFLNTNKQTGHAVWPCSRLLCDFLEENPHVVRGRRVLELGCGLGLCGSVAAVLGAHSVRFTDGDEEVLRKAEQAAKMNLGSDVKITFDVLRWGARMPEVGAYDVILGSDLLYGSRVTKVKDDRDERVIGLLETVVSLLAPGKESTFLLAFERRDVSFDEIIETADKLNLSCCVPEGDFYEDIFANRTESMTDFWRFCLFKFQRKDF